jgi:hypothetical protein
MVRTTTKEALSSVKGVSTSARKLRALILQLDKGIQQSITRKEIVEHSHQKFKESVNISRKARTSTDDWMKLAKARVITTEDVIKLREAK